MKKTFTISLLVCIVTLFALIAATERNGPDPIAFNIPAGWPKPSNNIFSKNKLTEQGFQLGKRLFYDGILSKDGEISCASCHQQFASFATYDHDLSHGVHDGFSKRNAPALINLAWMNSFQWDGGANHIEVQPLAPLTAPNEMGEHLDSILLKLRKDPLYPKMFNAAFGDPLINSQRILKSLAQFTGSLISANSKYDKVKRGEANFSRYELAGYEVFKKNCASCHKEPLFTDNSYRNNGLTLNRFNDIGRQTITNESADSLKFKVPTLRNTQVTFPYMHDGRIYSLQQVVDHYVSGIDFKQQTLDSALRNRLVINNREKNELVYFLYTLTDSSFLKDPRFAPSTVNQ